MIRLAYSLKGWRSLHKTSEVGSVYETGPRESPCPSGDLFAASLDLLFGCNQTISKQAEKSDVHADEEHHVHDPLASWSLIGVRCKRVYPSKDSLSQRISGSIWCVIGGGCLLAHGCHQKILPLLSCAYKKEAMAGLLFQEPLNLFWLRWSWHRSSLCRSETQSC